MCRQPVTDVSTTGWRAGPPASGKSAFPFWLLPVRL